MPQNIAISKVKTSDGVVHDFSTTHYIQMTDAMWDKIDVTWNVNNFTGTVSLISGTTDDYLLTISGAVS